MTSAGRSRSFRPIMPASLRRRIRRLLGRAVYRGDYPSWTAARKASEGYDSPAILEKTLEAARAVRNGRAAWERDTVLFFEPRCNQPLLSALRQAAATEGGRLDLVDIGGSLGSTWWQHRAWLVDLVFIRWNIVEQAPLVRAARREFEVPPLRFHVSLDACCERGAPSVALLSSVLPYVEAPHALLEDLRRRQFRHVIIDRTGFTRSGRDRLTVQRVPPSIYPASYPCWFFDRDSLVQPFSAGWRINAEWVTEDEADIDGEHGGLYLERM